MKGAGQSRERTGFSRGMVAPGRRIMDSGQSNDEPIDPEKPGPGQPPPKPQDPPPPDPQPDPKKQRPQARVPSKPKPTTGKRAVKK